MNFLRIQLREVMPWLTMAIVLILGSRFPVQGAVIEENFSGNPFDKGWRTFGDTNLFSWDQGNQLLNVTWDSSKTNSYFYRHLETPLTRKDDFELSFDLTMNDVMIGVDPRRRFTFQVAVGLINWQTATNPSFRRGAGTAAENVNIVEFTYFPDSGFGATISPVVLSSNRQFIAGFNYPIELSNGDLFTIAMKFVSTNNTLFTELTKNGQPFNPIKPLVLPANFTDFQIDTLTVSSYSHEGADGSILAHGTIDNISFKYPFNPTPSISGMFTNGSWQLRFPTVAGRSYFVERSTDLRNWENASARIPGGGESATWMEEIQRPVGFYRVREEEP